MGGIKFVPDFESMGTQDQWYDIVGGAGKITIGVTYQPTYGGSMTVDVFELATVIGKKAGYVAYLCPQDHTEGTHCSPK